MQHTQLDVIWVLISGFLVFLMQAGFMCLEVGLVRQKNSINVAIKNVVDFLISSISFFFVGFALMFGTSFQGIIGTDGWFLNKYIQLDSQGWIYTFWFFQVVFCGAAATIVSGGVAERMRFSGYMIISFVISTFIYPVFGHWVWAGAYDFSPTQGWLAALGYKDFAGSSVVHMVGGVTTLACLMIIGPRKGKYNPDGSVNKVWGCDIPMSTLGLFLLWLGWFGFNGGSTLAANQDIARIVINTNLAACSGGLSCLYFSWKQSKNLDVQSIINGCLGGLVAVTASCAFVSPQSALIIGALAGPVLVVVDRLLEKLHIDDAVGAVSVHGACGALGVLCVGFFAEPQHLVHHSRFEQILIQTLGVGVCIVYTFSVTWIIMKFIDQYVTKLRVSPETEEQGLNISEHGARTVWYDLVEDMQHIQENNDLNKRAVVEPISETAVVASMFNKLMDSLQQKIEELKQAQNQLVQSEKLASIGQLAAGVAHEINNPVGFINNNMEVLGQYIADYGKLLRMVENVKAAIEQEDLEKAKLVTEEMKKFEQEINLDYIINDINNLLQHNQRGIERIQKIVLDLRTFAREDTDTMDLIKVEEVIDSILSIVDNELKYKAELKKSYGQTPLIKCNSQRLGQVFINLFINAAQAIEEKGIIEVKTYVQDNFVSIDVADTGKGIPLENLRKIFDAFFTTKPVGQGTGLGLSVSYEIVKKHGGEIKVKSKVGEGTTFTIMLPIN